MHKITLSFPIDDILFHCEIIFAVKSKVVLNQGGPDFLNVLTPNFKGEGPQISDPISQITLTS